MVHMTDHDMELAHQSRNALITAVGVIAGFALSFIGQWALASGDWEIEHRMPGIILTIGVLILVASLFAAVVLERTLKNDRTVVAIMALGVVVVLLGVALIVRADVNVQKRRRAAGTHARNVTLSPNFAVTAPIIASVAALMVSPVSASSERYSIS